MRRSCFVASVVLMVAASWLPACGGPQQGIAKAPTVEGTEEGQSTCKVAKDPLNPLIVEWPGTSKVSLDSASRQGVVVVSYVGCVLKVLGSCQAGGSYDLKPVTPVRDKVSIESETELYARLPLGVASLKGELKRAQRLELEYVAVGQRETAKPPVSLSGECEGATHYVRSIMVGAYGLDAVGHASGGAGASVGDQGVSASRREFVRRLRASGNVTTCEQANAAGCDAILQLGLAPLDVGRHGSPAPAAATAPAPTGRLDYCDITDQTEAGQRCTGKVYSDSGETVKLKVTKSGTYHIHAQAPWWVKIPLQPVLNVADSTGKSFAKDEHDNVAVYLEPGDYKITITDAYKGDPAQFKGGFSFELEVKQTSVVLCGRYQLVNAGNGILNLGTGLVRDSKTGLTWARFRSEGGKNQAAAIAYCSQKQMRLPTKGEAESIAGSSRCTEAWPEDWWTWTSSPAGAGRAWYVDSSGHTFGYDVGDSYYGSAALCVR